MRGTRDLGQGDGIRIMAAGLAVWGETAENKALFTQFLRRWLNFLCHLYAENPRLHLEQTPGWPKFAPQREAGMAPPGPALTAPERLTAWRTPMLDLLWLGLGLALYAVLLLLTAGCEALQKGK